jgi:DNA-directed RNA polymerase subunit K/omega
MRGTLITATPRFWYCSFGARPEKGLVDRWRLRTVILVRRAGQLLKVAPRFVRPVEDSFTVSALDQIANRRIPLPLHLRLLYVPKLYARQLAQLAA